MQEVPVNDIKVRKRIRKDMRDIAKLAESLKRYGLICPIVISDDNVLIAGHRRLEAARRIGWRKINAVRCENKSPLVRLEMELEENLQRHDFDIDEIAEATRRIYKLRNPGILRRIFTAIAAFFLRLFAKEPQGRDFS
jgi:ParB family chromosome partitioning protein